MDVPMIIGNVNQVMVNITCLVIKNGVVRVETSRRARGYLDVDIGAVLATVPMCVIHQAVASPPRESVRPRIKRKL